jgi:large subunit ribosomal protein L4
VIVADEKDKTQDSAPLEGEADTQAKPARAPRKPAAKPAAAKAKAKAAKADEPDVTADVEPSAKAAAAADAAPAKPARRRAKPAAESAAKAKAKPARKRAATAKAAAPAAAPVKAEPAAPKTPRQKAAKPAPRPAVNRAPDERIATVFDAAGKQVEEIKLSPDRFGLTADINLLHLAVRSEQAARRSGSANTKTRGEVSGSTAKLYRQKGTGRARAGSVKSPTRIGGGTAFGPKPRSYDLKLNRKAARKALAMALSDRAEGGSIYVARGLDLDEPSTAAIDKLLVALDLAAPVLFVTDDEPVVAKSARNLRYAETGEVRRLSVEQVLRNRSIVVTEKALSVLTGA